MKAFLLLVVLPFVIALGLFTLLRRRGQKPVVAGCAALFIGVALTLAVAVITTLQALS